MLLKFLWRLKIRFELQSYINIEVDIIKSNIKKRIIQKF